MYIPKLLWLPLYPSLYIGGGKVTVKNMLTTKRVILVITLLIENEIFISVSQ